MNRYSEFVDRILLQPELLRRLCPSEPFSWDLVLRVREEKELPPLVRGALFYALDALEDGHRLFQDAPGDLGSYWHGMMHRREADFDNARYWFRRAGRMAFFPAVHGAVKQASGLFARQPTWDPYLFTGECEQAKYGAETEAELAKVQQGEFEAVFDYTWRQCLPAQ